MSEEYQQSCPHCQYPAHAGHAADCPTRDADSKESRDQNHELFVKFLEKHGIDTMSMEDKVDWIKKTPFEDVMAVVTRMNGRLAKGEKAQTWTGQATKSVVSMGGSSEYPDLEPPEHAEEELRLFYEKMQTEITPETTKDWAAKSYLATVFAHAFSDGNGRVSRNIYYLLSKEGVPPKEVTNSRGREIMYICKVANLMATAELFKKNGITLEEGRESAQLDEYDLVDNGAPIAHDMLYLKYLAARTVLESEGNDMSLNKEIDFTLFTDEQKSKFESNYKNLRQEWYHEVPKVYDKYKEWFDENFQKGILEK